MPKQKTTNQLDVSEGGFYEMNDNLYFVKENGDMFELDFDVSRNGKKTAIKNKIEKGSEMEHNTTTDLQTDITSNQVEENYWVETSKTKIDSSTAMMETRISKCMELTGKSREACSKEVKTRMKKEGSENTNTTDIKDEDKDKDKEEDVISEEEEEDTVGDTVDICPKELDMLKKKAIEYDSLIEKREGEKDEIAKLKTDFKDAMSYVDKLKEQHSKDQEVKRQEKISKLINDFQIPKGEIENDSIEEIEKSRRILDFALNGKVDEDEEITEDFEALQSDFNKKVAELDAHYKVKW